MLPVRRQVLLSCAPAFAVGIGAVALPMHHFMVVHGMCAACVARLAFGNPQLQPLRRVSSVCAGWAKYE